MTVHVAPAADIDATTLYNLIRLRIDVFVVEQECPYPELDGRDLEPGALQLWIERDGEIRAALRLLADPVGARIGRVVTAKTARSEGLAGQLVARALELSAGRAVTLDAQAHLEGWYARFGFARSGADFVEDGIPHVPMTRPADPA